ncbi:MAG: choice-of-anchor L domain-containing protein, partial [Phycisphaerales bacterium]|nr:choice-of-anchor L domain-containing protein [Phycisphaerales bacterium]
MYAMLKSAGRLAAAVGVALGAGAALGDVQTVVTTNEADLTAALNPIGLTVDRVTVRNGEPGQIGTYAGFSAGPVTIRRGVVLSSGSVAALGPNAAMQAAGYDPASPPTEVNSSMAMGASQGAVSEFDGYGAVDNHIENFQGGFDVAALEVRFTLSAATRVEFDFVFASVEFPVYTSSYTDAFLVFLDGTLPTDQICFDSSGSPVQVGMSFAGLETTADVNTAFAAPHALVHHLTTTTGVLAAGPHRLLFEVGDVNDQILDSAVFIAGLRTTDIAGGGGGG